MTDPSIQPGDIDIFIKHADVFNDYVMPRIRLPQEDWDNQGKTVEKDAQTWDACEDACVADDRCMQFSFNATANECKTLDSVRLGEAAGWRSGIKSDWLFDRIEKWRNEQPPCDGEWFLFDEDFKGDMSL
jgi:hypothetical protein